MCSIALLSEKDYAMKKLLLGHFFLIICCIFYLLWWKAGFYPGVNVNRLTGKVGLLFYVTAIFGGLGIYETLTGITLIPSDNDQIKAGSVILAGILTYIILIIVSTCLFHRQVTTELFLIIGWAVLETVSINRAFSSGSLTWKGLMFLWVIVLLSALVSFGMYMAYYSVAPMTGFILGTIPLVLAALNMLLFIVICSIMNSSLLRT